MDHWRFCASNRAFLRCDAAYRWTKISGPKQADVLVKQRSLLSFAEGLPGNRYDDMEIFAGVPLLQLCTSTFRLE